MFETTRYEVTDMHTAGEPVRIVTAGYPVLEGATILEKRREARARFDHIRRVLMLEPRGHAGMYGVIPVPVSSAEADLAVLFTHNEGYSTMCGHATIAIGRWAVEAGLVPAREPVTRFRLEVPCGVVDVAVEVTDGQPGATSFDSVPAFVHGLGYETEVPGFGRTAFDIAFGGAYYAILPASALGLRFRDAPLSTLIDAGAAVTRAVRSAIPIAHPEEPDLGFLYGTILTDGSSAPAPSANLCIFAEGQIDRSPTGSGLTARMALDHAKGLIACGVSREFRGVSGVPFTGRIIQAEGGWVRVRVRGTSSVTAHATFHVEPGDPLAAGFELPVSFAAVQGAGD
ncbi:MAG: proline racemase [Acidobacteria bacterium]|nr:proline racemase [Acidobacteriota bacterium]